MTKDQTANMEWARSVAMKHLSAQRRRGFADGRLFWTFSHYLTIDASLCGPGSNEAHCAVAMARQYASLYGPCLLAIGRLRPVWVVPQWHRATGEQRYRLVPTEF